MDSLAFGLFFVAVGSASFVLVLRFSCRRGFEGGLNRVVVHPLIEYYWFWFRVIF